MKSFDSIRFISSSLKHHVDNLSEIYNEKCCDKNCKSEYEFKGVKNDELFYDCKKCRTEQLRRMNELIKKLSNTYELCNGEIKFILMLRKGVSPYEHMDGWKKFNEVSLLDKKAFYSELNLEDISPDNYILTQKAFEEFKFKNLGEYYDLYLGSNMLPLTEVFENFRSIYLEINEVDPARFISASGLAWQVALKKTVIELDLLTDINMLLMVEKSFIGGIFNAVNHHAKANNKCMEDFEEAKEWQYFQYRDVNNLCGWTISQKFPAFNFEWVEDTSQFNAVFIKKL